MFPLIILVTWLQILCLMLLPNPVPYIISLLALSFPGISFIQFCLLKTLSLKVPHILEQWSIQPDPPVLSPFYRWQNLDEGEVDSLTKIAEIVKGKKSVRTHISDFHLSLFQFPHTAFETAWCLAHFHLTDAHVRRDAYRYAPDNTRQFSARTYSKWMLMAQFNIKCIAFEIYRIKNRW